MVNDERLPKNPVKWRIAAVSGIIDTSLGVYLIARYLGDYFPPENGGSALFIAFLYISIGLFYAYFIFKHFFSK